MSRLPSVAPFAGAWIEIALSTETDSLLEVAPFAGAWIEIESQIARAKAIDVAPFAGAWIEMTIWPAQCLRRASLPSRERGLK